MILVAYVDADGQRKIEKRYRLPGDQVLREQIVPGLYGYEDLHVTHIHMQYENEQVFIVAVTNYALAASEQDEIQKAVWAFLDKR